VVLSHARLPVPPARPRSKLTTKQKAPSTASLPGDLPVENQRRLRTERNLQAYALCRFANGFDLRLHMVTDFTLAHTARNRKNRFCGIQPQKRDRGLHPETEERFWCGLEAVQEVTERPGQLGLQVQTIFQAVLAATFPVSQIRTWTEPLEFCAAEWLESPRSPATSSLIRRPNKRVGTWFLGLRKRGHPRAY
jgi:hypothetical protein